MKLTVRYLAMMLASLTLRVSAQSLRGDVVQLRPAPMPLTCNTGDLRIDSSDLYKLKMCRLNAWVPLIEYTAAVTNPLNGTLSISGALSVTGYGVFSGNVTASSFVGNVTGNVVGALTGRADTSGTASFATASTTASSAGTAAFASASGTASAASAFTTTPSGCSANQYAQFIAPNGTLTCAQVSFSQLTGTASIAQGGTNNGTLAVTNGGVLYTDGTRIMNMGAGTSGQSIRSVGSGTPVWRTATTTIQKITTGSGTYTLATNALWLHIQMVGAGAGGAGSGTAPGAAGDGTDSTFGNFTAAKGLKAVTQSGGAGGVAAGGDVNINGQSGQNGTGNASQFGGAGGGTHMAPGGHGGTPTGGTGQAGVANTGAGGGGGGDGASAPAGAGGGGGAYIEKYISAPAATYSYSVGVGGTAGSAGTGTNTASGGAGADGLIIIEEFY